MFNGQEIRLSRKEIDLLILFAESLRYILTRKQIYREIWGARSYHAAENSINSCLRRIRHKLEEMPKSFCRLKIKRSVGILFHKRNTKCNKKSDFNDWTFFVSQSAIFDSIMTAFR